MLKFIGFHRKSWQPHFGFGNSLGYTSWQPGFENSKQSFFKKINDLPWNHLGHSLQTVSNSLMKYYRYFLSHFRQSTIFFHSNLACFILNSDLNIFTEFKLHNRKSLPCPTYGLGTYSHFLLLVTAPNLYYQSVEAAPRLTPAPKQGYPSFPTGCQDSSI